MLIIDTYDIFYMIYAYADGIVKLDKAERA